MSIKNWYKISIWWVPTFIGKKKLIFNLHIILDQIDIEINGILY